MSFSLTRGACLVSLFALALVAACDRSPPGGPAGDGPGDRPGGGCRGGACDAVERPALRRVDLSSLVSCWSVLDTSTTDPFFVVDRIQCRLASVQAPGLRLPYVYVTVDSARGQQSVQLDPARAGETVAIAALAADAYPITVGVTLLGRLESSVAVIRERTATERSLAFGAERVLRSRAELGGLTEAAPLAAGLPFDLDPVVLWPSAELSAAWGSASATGLVASFEQSITLAPTPLHVAGPTATTALSVTLRVYLGGDDPSALGRLVTPVLLPVVRGAALHAVGEVGVHTDVAEPRREATIAAAGYYLVALDGSLSLGDPAHLPGLASATGPDAGVPVDEDASAATVDSDASAGPPDDAGTDAGPIDPCAGACGTGQVCVAAACVDRFRQAQPNCWDTPRARCDVGEDGDCADGNVCVAGLCRQRACQAQNNCWDTATRVCEADDGDCADGHVCVGGLCRQRACQAQNNCWDAATRPCEGDDDGDCAVGNVCAASFCRQLACQTQGNCWDAPVDACDVGDDGDCASGNLCVAGRCARTDCSR